MTRFSRKLVVATGLVIVLTVPGTAWAANRGWLTCLWRCGGIVPVVTGLVVNYAIEHCAVSHNRWQQKVRVRCQ